MRFVWLEVGGGGEIPVNPYQVAYLRAGHDQHEGKTEVVFGAVNGGLHSVIVNGDGRDVAEKLEDRSAVDRGVCASFETQYSYLAGDGSVRLGRPPPTPPARPEKAARAKSKA